MIADAGSLIPGALMPLCSPSGPPVTTTPAQLPEGRLDYLQQSVDAIALEVERLGEAHVLELRVGQRLDPPAAVADDVVERQQDDDKRRRDERNERDLEVAAGQSHAWRRILEGRRPPAAFGTFPRLLRIP